MDKFTFVILHYMTSEDTIECVDSIINNISYENYEIIIVDNASPNDSWVILSKKYKDLSKVFLLKSDRNLGFANGNNLGYRFAKETLKSDFIICINNDTIINQYNFLQLIQEIYKNTGFSILGPKIISIRDNINQNPQRLKGVSQKKLNNIISKYKFLLLLSYLHLDEMLLNCIDLIKRNCTKDNKRECENETKQHMEGIQLHGACIIYSPIFLKKSNNAFYTKTFMYMEEDILNYFCCINHLKCVYNSNLIIYHKEDSSTNVALNSSIKKRRFFYRNSIKSGKELNFLMSINKIDSF